MTSDINFKSLLYNNFSIHESAINSEHDPDINFYQDISFLETHYCSPNDFQNNFQKEIKERRSKGDQRKNFTQKNCKSLKVMRKKHGVL